MQIEILNPIYDVVFEYMTDDISVAKILIESIIETSNNQLKS
jgi:hypothetical protein